MKIFKTIALIVLYFGIILPIGLSKLGNHLTPYILPAMTNLDANTAKETSQAICFSGMLLVILFYTIFRTKLNILTTLLAIFVGSIIILPNTVILQTESMLNKALNGTPYRITSTKNSTYLLKVQEHELPISKELGDALKTRGTLQEPQIITTKPKNHE